jgi:hypothetical protein
MWETMDELMEAIAGEWGEDEQAAAIDFAESSGLLAQWAAHEEAEDAGGYDQALEEEFQRVEALVGRKLSQGEEQGILDSISPDEKRQGVVPNMVEEFGQVIGDARNHEDGRVHLGAEAAARAFEAQGRGSDGQDIPQPVFTPPEAGDDEEGY